MRPTLRTPRLTLRPLTEDDLDDLAAMNGDPKVMAFIGRPMSREEVAAELPGWVSGDGEFGLWVGALGGLGALGWLGGLGATFVGVWFLSRLDDEPAGEIGWRLPVASWGHGYAVEGARAIVAHAFDTLGLHRLKAETMAVNARSRRVMERLGMRHLRTYVGTWEDPIEGWEEGEVVYEITPGLRVIPGDESDRQAENGK